MTKTTFRTLGLTSCMLLALGTGIPLGTFPASAQSFPPLIDPVTGQQINPLQPVDPITGQPFPTPGQLPTLVDPVTGQTIPNPAAAGLNFNPTGALITPTQFAADPTLLFANSGNLANNLINLQLAGVPTADLAGLLASAGGGGNLGAGDWTGLLNNIGAPGVDPITAAQLAAGVFAGTVNPDLGDFLGNVPNLGNVTNPNQLIGLINNPVTASIIAGLNSVQAGTVIDQVIQAALGTNFTQADLQQLLTQGNINALTNAIMQAAPQLGQLLGPGGVAFGVNDLLTQLAGNSVNNAAGVNNGFGLPGGPGATNGGAGAPGAGGGGGGGGGGALAGGQAGGLGAQAAVAGGGPGGATVEVGNCACTVCTTRIPQHHENIRTEVTDDFIAHRQWMLTTWFRDNILPAMMLMAEQLTTAGMMQVEVIGTFLDAKHQLETQRLFQTLTAQAHKDYHPSEGMCTFGTNVRSLAGSERRSNLAQTAFTQRMIQRETLNGDTVSGQSEDSDVRSRVQAFINTYCDPADNANGLNYLCVNRQGEAGPERRNIDVDYTRNIESRLTLDTDFFMNGGGAEASADETDVFALAANLYAHNIAPQVRPNLFGSETEQNQVRVSVAEKYLQLRSIFAKRSVAQNSFAAIVGMRAAGAPESAPYTKAVMKELGIEDNEEIEKLLGENPSYFAQMEVLTKKLYQNPVFYTELYDKPVNVERKGAALQAIGLMQDRDLYNSLLRSEAVLSVLLETQLQREQENVVSKFGRVSPGGGAK